MNRERHAPHAKNHRRLAFMTDITERRASEIALQEPEHHSG